MKLAIALSSLLSIAILTTSVVIANEAMEREGPPFWKVLRELDLTMAQRQRVRALLAEAREARGTMRADMSKMRFELLTLMASGNINQTSINGVLAQYTETLKMMLDQQGRTRYGIASLLDPSQQEKATALRAALMSRMAAREPAQYLPRIAQKLALSAEQQVAIAARLPRLMELKTLLRNTVIEFHQLQTAALKQGAYDEQVLEALFTQQFPAFQTHLAELLVELQGIVMLLDEQQKQQIWAGRSRFFWPRMG